MVAVHRLVIMYALCFAAGAMASQWPLSRASLRPPARLTAVGPDHRNDCRISSPQAPSSQKGHEAADCADCLLAAGGEGHSLWGPGSLCFSRYLVARVGQAICGRACIWPGPPSWRSLACACTSQTRPPRAAQFTVDQEMPSTAVRGMTGAHSCRCGWSCWRRQQSSWSSKHPCWRAGSRLPCPRLRRR